MPRTVNDPPPTDRCAIVISQLMLPACDDPRSPSSCRYCANALKCVISIQPPASAWIIRIGVSSGSHDVPDPSVDCADATDVHIVNATTRGKAWSLFKYVHRFRRLRRCVTARRRAAKPPSEDRQSEITSRPWIPKACDFALSILAAARAQLAHGAACICEICVICG